MRWTWVIDDTVREVSRLMAPEERTGDITAADRVGTIPVRNILLDPSSWPVEVGKVARQMNSRQSTVQSAVPSFSARYSTNTRTLGSRSLRVGYTA